MKDIQNSLTCPNCGALLHKQKNATALPLKTILNKRFIVGRVLGNPGGFGITYLVWDMLLETTAAIKEFFPLSSVSRNQKDMTIRANSRQDLVYFKQGLQVFLKEAKTLAQFSHPNIVRIRDCFTSNNTAYLVMEYHEGQPLDQLIAQAGGRLSEDKALELILPILEGLDAVHKKKFLHRDIKPKNIYITDQGIPLLLDFGASRFALTSNTNDLTVILSAGYAPFEQYHKKGKQGIWSDIYSIGATLYYMTTGKMPNDALERQHDDSLLAPIKLNPQLSVSFNQAILKAMSVNPQSRPDSIDSLKQSLMTGNLHLTPASQSNINTHAIQSTAYLAKKRKTPIKHKPSLYGQKTNPLNFTRILLPIGIVAIIWSGWNSRQAFTNAPPVSVIKTSSAITADSISQEQEIETIDSMQPIYVDSEINNPKAPIIIDQPPEQVKRVVKNLEPVHRQPASNPARPPAMIRAAIATCKYKSPHSQCTLPKNNQAGICLPEKHGQLACFPKYPPPPHLPPRFRR